MTGSIAIEVSSLEKKIDIDKNDIEYESKSNEKQIIENDIAERVIDNANNYFLVKILSPEITGNENKKREHKDKLIKIIPIFLIAQFIVLVFLTFGVIVGIYYFHWIKNDLDLSYVQLLVGFISAYISSVVAELFIMLKYIVSNVFDTSITGLVELYRDVTKQDGYNVVDR